MSTPFIPQEDWPLEPTAGDTHKDPQGRLWTCHSITGGAKGGRWAYFPVSDNPDQLICATCSHKRHLHDFISSECLACDDPTVSIERRCPAFATPPRSVLADTTQNLQAAHFAGMLSVPYDGTQRLMWVLGREWCQVVPQPKLELETKEAVRFEQLTEPPSE